MPERPTPSPMSLVAENTGAASVEPVNTASAQRNDGEQALAGEVQQFRRGWRLRYAPLDVAEEHGGSVSLVGAGLDYLKEGARIRVTGNFLPDDDRPGGARFQVRAFEVLDK